MSSLSIDTPPFPPSVRLIDPRPMPEHTRATRLVHMALAAAIAVQLLASLVMATPLHGHENVFFEIHEYGGLVTLVLASGFWLVALRRRRGTPMALLLPWFSDEGRKAVWLDLQRHWQSLRERTVPEAAHLSPLASAVHGLGLLLVSAMALTGALFYLAILAGATKSTWATLDIELHALLASLVWAYLIGHSGMALLHHFSRRRPLDVMWRR